AMIGTGTLSFSDFRGLPAIMTFSDLNNKDQATSNVLAQDIRRANGVAKASAHELVLKVPRSASADETISYTYDPSTCVLTRRDHRGEQLFLNHVDSFTFSFPQRPAMNTHQSALVPASASEARAVACNWSSSKRLLGTRLGSENMQMGPVVL